MVEGRKVLTIDEAETLERVQGVYQRFVERAGLQNMRKNPERFWGVSRSSHSAAT